MDNHRWDNFLAILANANLILHYRDGIKIGSYVGILDLHHGVGGSGYSTTLLPLALNEIEQQRERIANLQSLADTLEDRAEAAESALADAGIVRCQGDGCDKYGRAVLMHNDLCAECHATEVSIGNIFGDQRAEDEANYNQIVRDGLRWSR